MYQASAVGVALGGGATEDAVGVGVGFGAVEVGFGAEDVAVGFADADMAGVRSSGVDVRGGVGKGEGVAAVDGVAGGGVADCPGSGSQSGVTTRPFSSSVARSGGVHAALTRSSGGVHFLD